MSEFKGTKGKLTVKEAIGARGEVLYFNVQRKGNSIAYFNQNPYTEIPTSLDCAKANAVLFSKAPEILEMLKILIKDIEEEGNYSRQTSYDITEAKQLIKEATE